MDNLMDKLLMQSIVKKDGKLDTIVKRYRKVSQEYNLITPPAAFYTTSSKKCTNSEIKNYWLDYIGENRNEWPCIDFYIGIAYCKGPKRCSYCMYHSKTEPGQQELNEYLEKLAVLMDDYKEVFKGAFHSLYVGGGTPNILSVEQMEFLLSKIMENYTFMSHSEKTYENSPACYSKEKIKLLHDYGINRLSFGIQSFDETVLNAVNRYYTTPKRMSEIIEDCSQYGFKNVNVDLMIGLEQQTILNCTDSFKKLCEIGPNTITVYVNRHINYNDIQNKEVFLENYYKKLIYPALDGIYEIAEQKDYINLVNDKTQEFQLFMKKDTHLFENIYRTRYDVEIKNSCFGIGSNSISYINSKESLIDSRTEKNPDKFDLSSPIFYTSIIDKKDLMRLYVIQKLYMEKRVDFELFFRNFHRDFLTEFKFETVCLEALGKADVTDREMRLLYDTNEEFGVYGMFFYNQQYVQWLDQKMDSQ